MKRLLICVAIALSMAVTLYAAPAFLTQPSAVQGQGVIVEYTAAGSGVTRGHVVSANTPTTVVVAKDGFNNPQTDRNVVGVALNGGGAGTVIRVLVRGELTMPIPKVQRGRAYVLYGSGQVQEIGEALADNSRNHRILFVGVALAPNKLYVCPKDTTEVVTAPPPPGSGGS